MRFLSNTRVALQLKPRQPTTVSAWGVDCQPGDACEVLLDQNRDLRVQLDVAGASHMQASMPFRRTFERTLERTVLVGDDIYLHGWGLTGSEGPPGVTLQGTGFFLSKLGSDGVWLPPQMFGETWSDDTQWPSVQEMVATPTGELLGVAMVDQTILVPFRGAGGTFARITLPTAVDWLRAMPTGLLGGKLAGPGQAAAATQFGIDGKPVRQLSWYTQGTVVTPADAGSSLCGRRPTFPSAAPRASCCGRCPSRPPKPAFGRTAARASWSLASSATG